MVLSLIFIPALLMVLPEKVSASQEGSGTDENLSSGVHQVNFMDRLFQKSLDVMTAWVLRNARPVLLAALAICVISIYGLSQVKVESSFGKLFSGRCIFGDCKPCYGKNVWKPYDQHCDHKSGEEEPWKNPDNLEVVEEFQEILANEPRVKRTLSLVDLIKRISYAFNENRKEFNRLPNRFEFLESEEIFEENGQTEKRTVKREISGPGFDSTVSCAL